MAIEFSQATLRGFGRKHLWKIIYEMAKQVKNEQFDNLNEAIQISNSREGTESLTSVLCGQDCQMLLSQLERRLGVEVADADFLVTTKDAAIAKADPAPIVLILENLRSAFNVGNCFRSAESFLIERVIVTGYTPSPENSKTAKSALGTDSWMSWDQRENSDIAIDELRAQGYSIYAIETAPESKALEAAQLKYPCAFILGNERYGVSESTLEQVDEIFHIPLFGRKNSLNVSVCAGIVLHQGRQKWIK